MITADKFYEIQQNFFGRNRDNIVAGLDRITQAAQDCQNPQFACKIVHVAGTNGKGSTASMIAAGLTAAGFKVGLFTSPHIFYFSERFRINGKVVGAQKWLSVYDELSDVCEKHSLTFFEISTLIGFMLFKREKCDWVVLETGMGGRLDATNICMPKLSVITTIGMDHMEYLGDTVDKIAGEKLGIVKQNIPLVISAANVPSVIDLAHERCRHTSSQCIVSDLARIKIAPNSENLREILLDDKEKYTLTMDGDFQKINFVSALTALETLGFGGNQKVINAIAKTRITARMEKREINGKQVIFDVAHNPQSMEGLVKSLSKENISKPLSVIFGIMSDKDAKKTIECVKGIADKVFCFTPATRRAMLADYLAQDFKKLGVKDVFVCKSASEALERATADGETILVCGSFYVVSEILAAANFDVLG
ncbi:MAG: bifunctional folylpolyglutamate synthase/dihydrofolate synthase [Chitinivibrionia bacterium]|nr:bifunctional folylpolyglutamate synthase/dihydrofolate synthase [Chitinivibrionia bacterium]